MKKRLFIFDMGGVMCTNTNVTDDICSELEISKSQFVKYVTHANMIKIQSGKMSMNDFWNAFSNASGIRVEKDYFADFFNPVRVDCMYAFLSELKKNHRVVVGTNTIEPHYKTHLERGDYDLFEEIYPSHLLNIAKPDPEFYNKILEEENSKPTDAIFIDDSPKNVETANDLGIISILFESCEKLKKRIHCELKRAE